MFVPLPSRYAEIAQLVEHDLAKVGVASSSLVFRSKVRRTAIGCPSYFFEVVAGDPRTSDPESLRDARRSRAGVINSHAKRPASAGSSLVFRSKTKAPATLGLLFLTRDSAEGLQESTSQG